MTNDKAMTNYSTPNRYTVCVHVLITYTHTVYLFPSAIIQWLPTNATDVVHRSYKNLLILQETKNPLMCTWLFQHFIEVNQTHLRRSTARYFSVLGGVNNLQ